MKKVWLTSPWLLSLFMILAGAITTFAYAPFHLSLVPVFTLAALCLLVLRTERWQQAFWLGFCWGLGWFGAGINWVHIPIEQFGGVPLVFSLALMLLLSGYLALFPALAACAIFTFKTNRALPLLFAASWLLLETIRAWLLTGFPWLSLGYSQTDSILRHWAPLIGETGISVLIVCTAAALALLLLRRQWHALGFILPLWLIAPLLQPLHGWKVTGETVDVALVQGNIKQELRWDPAQESATIRHYMELTEPHLGTSLIIWPEAAIPRVEILAEPFLHELDALLAEYNSSLITGIIDYNFYTDAAWNSLITLGKQHQTDSMGHYQPAHANRFEKHHLLPIGEFVPFEDLLRPLAPIFDLPMSSFSRGDYVQNNLLANDYRLLPAICFEIAFPRQIAANLTADTQLLLTVSNDAWFGDSIGPHQHLQIARMRALEFGRPLLRATNNGITATIDANGQIQQQIPQFTAAVLTDQMQLTSGHTPYSRYGDWPLWLLSLVSLLWGSWQRFHRA
ncbi:apolipoprotein N-acyltransferase [Alkalimonas collagenimarina]|uniref:Apolipoprotein N-acyltransferase n=1 Tax=Alkalimonas collagenimarina TaxID=400390 RepID=A0ABT9H187_9GAMM|nr:apolipoprotein N-acyltransferase [Alkalimonas collagenimarina]MDP4537082.1 apolipoprotein N-acyltransferase [Alkalimonas collagenimarina]